MSRPEAAHLGLERAPKPRIKVLNDADFEMQESDIDGYKVLVLPEVIQKYFDEGYEAVRINSTALAAKLPDYGGRTIAKHSLTPHQDHLPDDPKRFLALSQTDDEPRGATTYFAHPETIQKILPELHDFFEQHRETLKENYEHSPASFFSEEDVRSCFEEGGYNRFIEKVTPAGASPQERLAIHCGILGYLIQGVHADQMVEQMLKKYGDEIAQENWEQGGVLIIDNSRVFHGRFGGNEDPIKRNWFIAAQ